MVGQKIQSALKFHRVIGLEGELVKLENPEFEKYFSIHSTDQVEARYILSHAFMENLAAFRKKAACSLKISFIDSRIFIIIHLPRDLWEIDTRYPLNRRDRIEQYVSDIEFLLGIIEELRLNKRIWSRQ